MKLQLTDKQRLALSVFEYRREVRVYHLPTYVGPRTMEQLVELGLIEPLDPSQRPFSRGSGWRLVAAPPAA